MMGMSFSMCGIEIVRTRLRMVNYGDDLIKRNKELSKGIG
jgi:hypothetical protein